MASSRDDKDQFFRGLYHLDELCSDDETCPSGNASERPLSTTAPITRGPKQCQKPGSSFKERPPQIPITSALDTRKPNAGFLPPPLLSRKPRSKKGVQSIPPADQIFNGLTFYFIPNNDIAAPRRKRIEKGLQYGAVWEKVWPGSVTHVIVDSNVAMKDVLRILGLDKLPNHVVCVNDAWLTESVSYRDIRIPNASRFRVKGAEPPIVLAAQPRATENPFKESATASSSRASLSPSVESAPLVHQKTFNNPSSKSHETHHSDDHHGLSGDRPNDPLDEIMSEMKGTEYLPLDLEDDDGLGLTPVSSLENSDSDSGTATRPPLRKKAKTIDISNSLNFSCMEKHDGTSKGANLNARTIEVLQQMATYYDRLGDNWRTLAYRRCITALRKENRLITNKEDAFQIRFIGQRLALKIEEIVTTNTLRRLESTTSDPNDQLLKLFMGIYQVGFPTASRWIVQGHRTLEDLRKNVDLTPNQFVGVEHYNDFAQRIPRTEVAMHADIVRKALQDADPGLQTIVGGSFRRGAADSGDIDVLITKEGASLATIRTIVLDTVVPMLTRKGFLKAALVAGTSRAGSEGSKWHGASALPGPGAPWRRLDLLFVPWCELGAALIYFTGNDIFNRSMRLLASRKGMRLNQHGLYGEVMRGEKRERVTEGTLVEGHSELRIFEILDVLWRPPRHRVC